MFFPQLKWTDFRGKIKWIQPPRQWHAAKAQFAIQFGDRFVLTV